MVKYNYFEQEEVTPFGIISPEDIKTPICESAPLADDQIRDFGEKQIRSQAMSAVLTWVDEGDYSYDALDVFVVGLADLDGDEEISDDEEDLYNGLLDAVGDAMVSLGADEDNVAEFLDGEDEDIGLKLGEFLSEKLDGLDDDDDTLVSKFAVGGDTAIYEAMVKKVRGGKVVRVKKKLKKVRLSSAQKAALKKARKKAHTGAAKKARKKALKVRKSRGL